MLDWNGGKAPPCLRGMPYAASPEPPATTMKHSTYLVPPGKKISLRKNYDPADTDDYPSKGHAVTKLQADVQRLAKYQDMLYAQDSYALLIVLQAMDAAGKNGTIKHVMSGVNPQGCDVSSFKAPSAEELNHDFLWRCYKRLPQHRRIGIFDRSYYEEVLVARVHPEILQAQRLPPELVGKNLWKLRFEAINQFEKHLVESGTVVLKFFLNVSKEEQKKRFLERIDRSEKNWKFSTSDAKKRTFWDDYQQAYEDAFNNTSTLGALVRDPRRPQVVHAAGGGRRHSRHAQRFEAGYPTVSKQKKQELLQAREILEGE